MAANMKIRHKILILILILWIGISIFNYSNLSKNLDFVFYNWPIPLFALDEEELIYEDDDSIQIEYNPEYNKNDPEVEEIINLILSEEKVKDLSHLVLTYPENEYFLPILRNRSELR